MGAQDDALRRAEELWEAGDPGPENPSARREALLSCLDCLHDILYAEPQEPAPEPEAVRLLRESRASFDVLWRRKPEPGCDCGDCLDAATAIEARDRIDAYLARQETRPDPWGGVTPSMGLALAKAVINGDSAEAARLAHLTFIRIPEPEEDNDDS